MVHGMVHGADGVGVVMCCGSRGNASHACSLFSFPKNKTIRERVGKLLGG